VPYCSHRQNDFLASAICEVIEVAGLPGLIEVMAAIWAMASLLAMYCWRLSTFAANCAALLRGLRAVACCEIRSLAMQATCSILVQDRNPPPGGRLGRGGSRVAVPRNAILAGRPRCLQILGPNQSLPMERSADSAQSVLLVLERSESMSRTSVLTVVCCSLEYQG
jgi:hypothetical protein